MRPAPPPRLRCAVLYVAYGARLLCLRRPRSYTADTHAAVRVRCVRRCGDPDDAVAIHSRAGDMVLFPPWLPHSVSPSHAPPQRPRVSFAFNLLGHVGTIPPTHSLKPPKSRGRHVR